jgi:hypothetical protein
MRGEMTGSAAQAEEPTGAGFAREPQAKNYLG